MRARWRVGVGGWEGMHTRTRACVPPLYRRHHPNRHPHTHHHLNFPQQILLLTVEGLNLGAKLTLGHDFVRQTGLQLTDFCYRKRVSRWDRGRWSVVVAFESVSRVRPGGGKGCTTQADTGGKGCTTQADTGARFVRPRVSRAVVVAGFEFDGSARTSILH